MAVAASALSTSANQVLADAVNAETGVRGYVATGDSLFLDPYNLPWPASPRTSPGSAPRPPPRETAAPERAVQRPRPRRWPNWRGCGPRSARAPPVSACGRAGGGQTDHGLASSPGRRSGRQADRHRHGPEGRHHPDAIRRSALSPSPASSSASSAAFSASSCSRPVSRAASWRSQPMPNCWGRDSRCGRGLPPVTNWAG